MAENERLSRISIRGEVIDFALDDRDEYHLATANGESLDVYLGGIDSNPYEDREIILVSPALAGRKDTGNKRTTEDGVRVFELSREGKGSQPLSQPEGGRVEVDLGRQLIRARREKVYTDLGGLQLASREIVFEIDPRFDRSVES